MQNYYTKRCFDFLLALLLLVALLPVMILCAFLVKITSKGAIVHLSRRVGANNIEFNMLKFRTMKEHTPQLATHLIDNPEEYLSPIGDFLRKTSLDELPQLINVLKGEMSLVGPRPALFNQYDLIELRKQKECHLLKPGITGWAQINGRDDISIIEKVELDDWYKKNSSKLLDFKIIILTLLKVVLRQGVSH